MEAIARNPSACLGIRSGFVPPGRPSSCSTAQVTHVMA